MRKACLIFFVAAACNNRAGQKTQIENDPVIPAIVVTAKDSSLQISNGVWYYRHEPYSGTIETFFASGSLQSRQSFFEGKEEGLLYTFYEDGSKDTRRFFRKGEKDSVHTGWWPNGKLRFEYHFENGIYQGDCKEWYESGQALKHIVYKDGKEQKGKGWRINGKPYMSFEVRDGRMYGLINPNLCYSLKNEKGEFVKTTK